MQDVPPFVVGHELRDDLEVELGDVFSYQLVQVDPHEVASSLSSSHVYCYDEDVLGFEVLGGHEEEVLKPLKDLRRPRLIIRAQINL